MNKEHLKITEFESEAKLQNRQEILEEIIEEIELILSRETE
jgi:hypothetical protein